MRRQLDLRWTCTRLCAWKQHRQMYCFSICTRRKKSHMKQINTKSLNRNMKKRWRSSVTLDRTNWAKQLQVYTHSVSGFGCRPCFTLIYQSRWFFITCMLWKRIKCKLCSMHGIHTHACLIIGHVNNHAFRGYTKGTTSSKVNAWSWNHEDPRWEDHQQATSACDGWTSQWLSCSNLGSLLISLLVRCCFLIRQNWYAGKGPQPPVGPPPKRLDGPHEAGPEETSFVVWYGGKKDRGIWFTWSCTTAWVFETALCSLQEVHYPSRQQVFVDGKWLRARDIEAYRQSLGFHASWLKALVINEPMHYHVHRHMKLPYICIGSGTIQPGCFLGRGAGK